MRLTVLLARCVRMRPVWMLHDAPMHAINTSMIVLSIRVYPSDNALVGLYSLGCRWLITDTLFNSLGKQDEG